MPGSRAAIVVAAAGSIGAGLIHAAAAGSHSESRELVWLFAACAAAQLGWAAVVVLAPSRRALFVGAGINGAAVVAWFLAHTVGISMIGALTQPEAVGTQDLLAVSLAAVALAATMLAITQPIARRSLPNEWSAAIVLFAVLLAVPALAAGHTHAGHDHLAAEHIHAGSTAAAGHDHGVEVAGAVAHNHDAAGGTSSSSSDGTGTTHSHTSTGAATTGTGHDHTVSTSGQTTPTNHNHTTDPTTPGDTTPPEHVHPQDPTGPVTPTGPIVSITDPRLIASQQQAAGTLLVTTLQAMTAFPDVAAVEAAGYQSIGDASTGFEHFVNWTYFSDSSELDPHRIESIVAKVNPDGSRTVASGMYILSLGKTMADVPDIAGPLTTWHDHQDLCWAPTPTGGNRVTGIAVNGQCPNGGVNVPTPPMLHVWLEPQACGPFSGIEGLHGAGCEHQH
ncbi:MAG: hypothetical protein ACXWA9_14505 [Acidimicrobiia bacterium]